MPASKKEAKEFVKRWKKRLSAIPAGSNNEQQDTQKFWVDLLINVLGIPSNTIDSFVDFERKVRGRRIDVFVSDHNFLCEQKSWGIDLDKPEPRNGGMETPLQQAMWYARHLPYSERPRWVMTCNFGTFRLYDLDNERPEDTVQEFSLEELPDSLYLLSFLTSNETSRLHKEQQLSIEAGPTSPGSTMPSPSSTTTLRRRTSAHRRSSARSTFSSPESSSYFTPRTPISCNRIRRSAGTARETPRSSVTNWSICSRPSILPWISGTSTWTRTLRPSPT